MKEKLYSISENIMSDNFQGKILCGVFGFFAIAFGIMSFVNVVYLLLAGMAAALSYVGHNEIK